MLALYTIYHTSIAGSDSASAALSVSKTNSPRLVCLPSTVSPNTKR